MLRNDFIDFLSLLNFDNVSKSEILEIYDGFLANKDVREIYDSYLIPYKEKGVLDFADFCQKAIPEISKITNSHVFKTNILCYPLAAYSSPFYEKAGVDYKVWYDSMIDFKCKFIESRLTVGVPCAMTNTWFKAWYYAERFCFTRLQFEPRKAKDSYKSARFDVKEGEEFITIHIPSMRDVSFSRENRQKSYKEAREYYEQHLGHPFVIGCESWLLADFHTEILPESSNIRGFTEEFERYRFKPHKLDLWRIYNIETDKLPDDEHLPEATDLQRRYKKFLLSGGMTGTSAGYLIE